MPRSLFARLQFAALLMLAPDDGGAAGGAGEGEPPAAGDGGSGDGSGAGDGGTGLTAEQQAAVDAEVRRQLDAAVTPKLNAAKAKWEKDLATFAEAQNLTAEQRADAARQAAESERDAARREALTARAEAAFERALLGAKVPADRVPAGLRLADLDLEAIAPDGKIDADAIKALAASTVQANSFLAATTTPPGASGGEHQGSSETKIFSRSEIASMSQADYVKNAPEIKRQMREGLIAA